MYIYVTDAQTSVAVCYVHRPLAVEMGWSYLEWQEETDDWPCYFATRTEN